MAAPPSPIDRQLDQKSIKPIPIAPPPESQRVQRSASFPPPDGKKTRYTLPSSLDSASPVGYRCRVSLTTDEAADICQLLSMPRPTRFVAGPPVLEQELFEECTLGVLTSRQSTNY